MSDKRPKKDSLEVSSQTLRDELVAIKDRLGAIETIQSISNVAVVKKFVEDHLTTAKAKAVMKACETKRKRSDLMKELNCNSTQALDHHVKPLRDAGLLNQVVEEDNTVVLTWSNLFRGLPKSTIRSILGG